MRPSSGHIYELKYPKYDVNKNEMDISIYLFIILYIVLIIILYTHILYFILENFWKKLV